MFSYKNENTIQSGVDECWTAIKYVYKNADLINVDAENIILMGDSQGGSLVTVMIKRIIENKLKLPILQALMYPRLNYLDYTFPSYLSNTKGDKFDDIHSALVKAGLNRKKINKNMIEEISQSKHLFLIEDTQTRLKYLKYIDYNLIPVQFKNGNSDYKSYVKNHEQLLQQLSLPDGDLENDSLLKNDEDFSKAAFKLLLPEVSPCFLSNSVLNKFPQTYMIIVENETVRDENFIFSERLKQNGVKVNVAYYLNKGKGKINESGYDFGKKNVTNERYIEDMIEFILNLFLKLYENVY